MSKLSVLMTVYNEADFIKPAIRACLPYVDHLVIVEGAYQETIKLGASPRSTDGTVEILKDIITLDYTEDLEDLEKIYIIEANEETDKDQRNVGLEIIKDLNPDGWCLIIDGDEVYSKSSLDMVKVACHTMDFQKKLAAYFKSITFVNDLRHFTYQEFPRLFKITPACHFVNDNFMTWPDMGVGWMSPYVLKIPYIQYHHYAFCKSHERFKLKKDWWESRFDTPFEYGWHINEDGKFEDPDHQIMVYTGKHPEEMENHPLWQETYGKVSDQGSGDK